jgi:hypothetical protein
MMLFGAKPGLNSPRTAGSTVADRVRAAVPKLVAYCQANDWSGYDPYDALNSTLFQILPFLDSKWPRLVLTQALKRSPVNIRRLALVPRTQNPKAVALFTSAFLNLARIGASGDEDFVGPMLDRIKTLRSTGTPYWCWGYSFPWQTRTLVVPRGAPNLVCTTFVANALLDIYEQRNVPECLEMAASAAEYILDELYWTAGESKAGLAYPQPSMKSQVHNGNLLGAALLSRVHRLTGAAMFLGPALRVARCSAAAQRPDGSWTYGEGANQQWVDNFHTGYNLCALRTMGRVLDTNEFEEHVERGFRFYRAFFLREDGAPRYFHDQTYPIDIHCVAQSIITLVTLRDLDAESLSRARAVLSWAMEHMWDDRGFFYYRVLRSGTIRTSYMRWSQAWMLLALATFLTGSRASSTPRLDFSAESSRD